jgi:hypothetical protein
MGHFNKPGFSAHDGICKTTNFNQFGREWQVLESESMIFNERCAPQHPEQCTHPTAAAGVEEVASAYYAACIG